VHVNIVIVIFIVVGVNGPWATIRNQSQRRH